MDLQVWRWFAISTCALGLAACNSSGELDGGGARKGDVLDVGVAPDSGGTTEAGVPDASAAPDARAMADGGVSEADAEAHDAALVDGGVHADAASPPDAGASRGYDLDYASYLGGGGFDRIQALHVDAVTGVITIGGTTQSSDFPTTAGAFDRTGAPGSGVASNDGFVARFAADGTLLWSTYLQGSDRDDVYGVRVDAVGDVIAVGWTASADFPTTVGAYDRTHNGSNDVFVAKISADGGRLLWSTFIGGSGIDQSRGAMALDGTGRVYLAGYTESTNFPTHAGAYQRMNRGGMGDALVAVVSADGASLVYATMLGGSGPDFAFSGLVLHPDGTVSVAGAAGHASFPTTPGAFQTTFGGGSGMGRWPGDAFVTRLSADLSTLVFSTFLGGSGDETASAQNALALHPSGDVIVSGATDSANFPTTAAALQRMLRGGSDLFVSRISADGATLVASTLLGGAMAGGYEASGLQTSASGDITLTGWTGVRDFPLTPNALQPTFGGGSSDTVITILAPDLGSLRYATFYGGTSGFAPGRSERIRVLAHGPGGQLVVGGDTDSNDLTLSPGAYQRAPLGDGDGFFLRLTPRP